MGGSISKGKQGDKGRDAVCDDECIEAIVEELNTTRNKLSIVHKLQNKNIQALPQNRFCAIISTIAQRCTTNQRTCRSSREIQRHFFYESCIKCPTSYVPVNVDKTLIDFASAQPSYPLHPQYFANRKDEYTSYNHLTIGCKDQQCDATYTEATKSRHFHINAQHLSQDKPSCQAYDHNTFCVKEESLSSILPHCVSAELKDYNVIDVFGSGPDKDCVMNDGGLQCDSSTHRCVDSFQKIILQNAAQVKEYTTVLLQLTNLGIFAAVDSS